MTRSNEQVKDIICNRCLYKNIFCIYVPHLGRLAVMRWGGAAGAKESTNKVSSQNDTFSPFCKIN